MENIELDPKQVLMHLNELGYDQISPEGLDEFVKDLKKLIKYEVTKKKRLAELQQGENSVSSTLPNTTDESLPNSPPPLMTVHSRHRNHHPAKPHNRDREMEVSSTSSESSAMLSRRVLRECTKHADDRNYNALRAKSVEASKIQPRASKSCDCLWRRLGCKCCEQQLSRERDSVKTAKSKENLAPPRPKSSFIRTWQSRPKSASQRSDPVALYQKYKQVWQQQKLPGEDNHNDLRWVIRERMLGQEPHPRTELQL